jgi:hypothetical protein
LDVPDRARILKLDDPPLAGRARYLAEADQSVLQTIHCGILFIMAFWSGTSYTSFSRLKQALTRLDPEGRLEVLVVDTDGCPELYEFPDLKDKLHGNGEAAWIREGRIICTAWGGSHELAFETFTQHLLSEFREQ